jgi:hypothetical protein
MTSDQQLGQLILFARHNFDDYQALIRASDAKAGVLVTLMVFLAASSSQVSKDAIGLRALATRSDYVPSISSWHVINPALQRL